TARDPLSPSPNHQGREGAGIARQAQPEQGEVAYAYRPTMGPQGVDHLATTHLSLHTQRAFPRARRYRTLCLCPLPIRPFTARTLLPAVLSPQRGAKSHASCQPLSATLCFRRQVAGAPRARRRRGARGDTATHGRAIAVCTFRASAAAGCPLAVPRAAAQLLEQKFSRMDRALDL